MKKYDDEAKPFWKERDDVGRELADELKKYLEADLREADEKAELIVLGIPRGGMPVAFEVAKAHDLPLDFIAPRKLPLPKSPEAGFGAVTEEGELVLNRPMVEEIKLTPEEIEAVNVAVQKEVERRAREYRGDAPRPDLDGKTVILVDDGLASGYTALAAVRAVKKLGARKVIVAAPVASISAYELLKDEVYKVVTLHVSRDFEFAVASYYEYFPEVPDEAVKALLEEGKEFGK
jgi:putative phosphoribosyl transferase